MLGYHYRVMKKALNDTRNIRRKRKDVTALGAWELKSKRFKEGVFEQPLFTGSSLLFNLQILVLAFPYVFLN